MASLKNLSKTVQDHRQYLKALDRGVKLISLVTREIIQENLYAKSLTSEILPGAEKFVYYLNQNSLSYLRASE